jgi:hypothetical protein
MAIVISDHAASLWLPGSWKETGAVRALRILTGGRVSTVEYGDSPRVARRLSLQCNI